MSRFQWIRISEKSLAEVWLTHAELMSIKFHHFMKKNTTI